MQAHPLPSGGHQIDAHNAGRHIHAQRQHVETATTAMPQDIVTPRPPCGRAFPVGHPSSNRSKPNTLNLEFFSDEIPEKKVYLVDMSILSILLSPGRDVTDIVTSNRKFRFSSLQLNLARKFAMNQKTHVGNTTTVSWLRDRFHWFIDPRAPSHVRAALQDVTNKRSQISTSTEGISSD
jgi:hypothetical protein